MLTGIGIGFETGARGVGLSAGSDVGTGLDSCIDMD